MVKLSQHEENKQNYIESLLTFRQAVYDDLSLLEWGDKYIHFRKLFAQAFLDADQGNAILWVCELPRIGMIGQVFVQLFSSNFDLADGSDRAYIHSVRIKPEYRRKGIGSKIMDVSELDLSSRKYREVVLNVARQNDDARRFYERRGYRIIGVDAGEWSYTDHMGINRFVKEPAWRMKKNLWK